MQSAAAGMDYRGRILPLKGNGETGTQQTGDGRRKKEWEEEEEEDMESIQIGTKSFRQLPSVVSLKRLNPGCRPPGLSNT